MKTRVFKVTGKEKLLAEVVRRFPLLYDRRHHTFKDKNEKNLALDDVAKEVDYPDGKKFFEKGFSNYN